MTLSANGKNYIAQKFGVSNCFVLTGLTWTAVANDGTQVTESGGTASIIGRLVTTSVYASIILNGVTYTYTQLKTANDNTDMTLADAQWVAANDGSPAGETQYCYTAPPPPTTGSISVTLSPANASLYLDGGTQAYATGTTIQNVPVGNHSYIAKAAGYKDKAGGVTVQANVTTPINETLEPLLTNEKITLSDQLAGNYNCYGFTIPKDQFTCFTGAQTAKIHAIYATGDCASMPAANVFTWYQWDLVQLRWQQYIATPSVASNPGFCRAETDLPCGYMYKVMYGNIEKVFTVSSAGMAEFGVGWLPIAAIGIGILLALKK